MKPPFPTSLGTCVFVFCLAFFPTPSPAAPVLELNFQNFDDSARTVAPVQTLPGTPTALPLSDGDASVDISVETGIATANPNLKTGYLEALPGSQGGGYLATSKNINEASASYAAYFGNEGFGSGTLVAIFQPNFSGALTGENSSQRACLFASNFSGTAAQAVVLWITKDIILSFGIGNTDPAPQRLKISQPDWNPEKWYFIAASWSPDTAPVLYVREIGNPFGSFAQSDTPLLNTTQPAFRNLVIGNAGFLAEDKGGGAPMNGKLAYFSLSDSNITTQADFDALYQSIVQPK